MQNVHAVGAVTCAACLLFAARASAEPSAEMAPRDQPDAAASTGGASAAADAGNLLPSVLSARIHPGSAFATARSGYDGASEAFVARAVMDGSLTSFLALRLDFEHGPSMGPENRLRIGGRLQLLNDEDHGLDGAVALFYDPNEFREEGNIVAGLLVSKRLGRLGLFGNALFGSDPEGDDQVLELRFAPLYRVLENFELGLDARGRYNMSSDDKRTGTLTRDWELQALPTASLAFGPFAVVAEAGLSAQRTTDRFGEPGELSETHTGILAMAGAAGAF